MNTAGTGCECMPGAVLVGDEEVFKWMHKKTGKEHPEELHKDASERGSGAAPKDDGSNAAPTDDGSNAAPTDDSNVNDPSGNNANGPKRRLEGSDSVLSLIHILRCRRLLT